MYAPLHLRSSSPVIASRELSQLLGPTCGSVSLTSSGRSVVLEPGFREQWQRLISEPLWAALVHLGVEEAADLAYLFSSQDEAREWAVLQQCGADADRFLVAWQLCRTIVDKDFSVVDKVLQLEHQRTRGAAPKAMPKAAVPRDHRPPLARPVSVKRRRDAITDSLTGVEQVRVIADVAATSSSINPAHPVHDELVALFCQSGPATCGISFWSERMHRGLHQILQG